MADIDVERKSPVTWVWWVLGLLLLAMLLFWLLAPTRVDRVAVVDPATEPMPVPTTVDPAPAAVPPALQEFQQRCAPRQPGEMGLEHEYTADCLRRLVGAIEGTVPQQQLGQAQPELQNAREAADRLARSPPDAMDHSQQARDGLSSAASALQTVQQQAYTDMGGPVQELQQTAQQVDPNVPLLEQRDRIQAFFDQAGALLGRMRGV